MLKAFIDDSQSFAPDPSYYVLGGYMAPIANWLAFSDDWQNALDAKPEVRGGLKFKDMLGLSGEFQHWSEERRNKKAELFYSIIEKRVSASFSVAIVPEDLQRVYAEFPNGVSAKTLHPFNFCMMSLMTTVGRNIERFEVERQPVDFIFDRQDMVKSRVAEGWEFARKFARPNPPDLLSILPYDPSFADDKDVLPLQAADLKAGWTRYSLVEKRKGKEPVQMWATNRRIIPSVHIQWSETQIRDFAKHEHESFDPNRFTQI